MSDIVARLREWQASISLHHPRYPMVGEAADEIERLQTALEKIAGSASDKLQAMQARCALDNIGPPTSGEVTDPFQHQRS